MFKKNPGKYSFLPTSTAPHDRVQHELRPARAVLVRGQIQRATDGHPGGGRILAKAATCLQAGAGAQYYVGRVERGWGRGDILVREGKATRKTRIRQVSKLCNAV